MPQSTLRLLALCLLCATGCAKQDADILSRVGRNLAEKAHASTSGLRERLPFRLTAIESESPLADRVQQRFATDKLLSTTTIQVQVNGAEVELKGEVEKEAFKNRAVDLAETTVGVEKVIDSLQIQVPR